MSSHLHKIEVFLRDKGMAPTRFGLNVAKDPRLVFDMRNGRQPNPKMQRQINEYIGGYNG